MPKFFIKTYGCQMNERDSEQVAYSLITRGYERVENETEADVVLLNTCSVRDMADQKALGKMGMLIGIRKAIEIAQIIQFYEEIFLTLRRSRERHPLVRIHVSVAPVLLPHIK